MIRGTSHIFRFDCSDAISDFTDATSFKVIFEQSNNSNSPIIKSFNVFWDASKGTASVTGDSGCSVNADTSEVLIELTPDETVLFTEDKKLKVQLTGMASNATFANYIQYVTVYPILDGQTTRAISNTGTSSYVLPAAQKYKLGGVKVPPEGNINISTDGTISINQNSVINALGYIPVKEGEAGTTEVYVGTDNPTANSDIKIWVNTSEGSSSNSGPRVCTIEDDFSATQEYRIISIPMAIQQGGIVVVKTIPAQTGQNAARLMTSIIWDNADEGGTKLCVSKVPGLSYDDDMVHYKVQVLVMIG